MNLGLSELRLVKNAEIINGGESVNKFSGVSIDSRSCRKNDLFIAIRGERFDGHDFVLQAVERGIKCAVVKKKWYKNLSEKSRRSLKKTCVVLVSDTITALGEIASLYRRKFAIPVIGIGGSNGKTTTKDLIAAVLAGSYSVLKTEGNYNNHIGVPLTLFRLRSHHEIAVIELGINRHGEMTYLAEIAQPQFAVITNIGREHMEYLGRVKEIARAEAELVNYIKRVYGTFIKNTDDSHVNKMGRSLRIKKFTYGSAGRPDVKGRLVRMRRFFPEIQITYRHNIININLNIAGYQGYQSALSAAATGIYFDVPLKTVKQILSEFQTCLTGRNNLLNINGTWIIDDTYNSNPDSVTGALNNLKLYNTSGEKYIVLGDMLELGKYSAREHKAIGRLIRKLRFRNLFTFGNEAYNIFKGAKGIENNFYFTDKKLLAEVLKSMIRKNDLVLVKGSRKMQMEDIIMELKG